jgi:hypothetical protein
LNLKNEFQIIYKLGSYTESVTGSGVVQQIDVDALALALIGAWQHVLM